MVNDGGASGSVLTFFANTDSKKVRTDPDALPSLTGYSLCYGLALQRASSGGASGQPGFEQESCHGRQEQGAPEFLPVLQLAILKAGLALSLMDCQWDLT